MVESRFKISLEQGGGRVDLLNKKLNKQEGISQTRLNKNGVSDSPRFPAFVVVTRRLD